MKFYSHSSFLTPPRYLRMPAIGMDISDRSFKFVELTKNENHFELGRYGRKIIPEGLIKSGEIIDQQALSEFLRLSLKDSDLNNIVLSLPEEKAFVGFVTLPKMSVSDIRGALELQIDEHVPFPASDVIFDYDLISLPEETDHTDVVIVAFPKKIVEAYLEVIKNAGLRPIIFEMEAHAVARAVLPKGEMATTMIVDFGRTRSSFVIVSSGIVRFTSTVNVAGEGLDKSIAKIFNVDIFEAERIKKEHGLVRTKENQEVFNALLPIVSAIREEIDRYLTFWKDHSQHLHGGSGGAEVQKIYLTGGDVNLLGLPEYLSYELKLPIELANPWSNITKFEDYIPELTYRESLSYATALGAALRGANFQ